MRLFATIALLVVSFSCHASFSADMIISLGLPTLFIETVGGEEPTCDYVYPPEGAFGKSINNATKVPGRVYIVHLGDTLYDSGRYADGISGMTIKIRGNTSAYSDKKPFKIRLEKASDMLSRGDHRYDDRHWALIRDGNSSLKTMIGNKVNQLIGMAYTPAYEYVNVFFNGDYRGIYMLTETIRRNPRCRINVAKSGFILECDPYWWNEDRYLRTPDGKYFTFKYPDDKDVVVPQLTYIASVVKYVENAITDGTYMSCIDVRSFARWLLAHDILGSKDGAGSNIFITKYDDSDTTLVSMSTLWDFDSIMKLSTDEWSRAHNDTFFYFKVLTNNVNTGFLDEYRRLWQEIGPHLFDDLIGYLEDFRTSPTALSLQASRPYEFERWNYVSSSVDDNINDAISWLRQHEAWLHQAMMTDDVVAAELSGMPQTHDAIYTLNGFRLTSPSSISELRRGVYVRKGKKYLK